MIVALMVVGVVVVPFVVISELIEATMGTGPLANFGWIAVPMAATAWLAPRASYRCRDALWWFTGPVGGLYIFVVIAWRLAFLPYRDWPPRPDEASRVRRLPDDQQAELWQS
ncbi:hypothetical protein AB0C02_29590 [Micromonospora sp. NPDC048999]|uniref:hypothetical protein n=1 Tax=Micromonospora sp. NPDC048999 TaxID=3155391 RepID=UPI0033D50B02